MMHEGIFTYPSLEYEQEYDEITPKLLDSRVGRKRAQEDVKLLANRIALLKQEEKKAWRKIEETKKKATTVHKTKLRNQEKDQVKMERDMQKERERMVLRERNQEMKTEVKSKLQ